MFIFGGSGLCIWTAGKLRGVFRECLLVAPEEVEQGFVQVYWPDQPPKNEKMNGQLMGLFKSFVEQ